MNDTNSTKEKIRLFALIEPLNLRMSLCFTTDSLVADIIKFVEDMIKKFLPKFKVGRVEWNGSWILPQYKIVDFFEDKSEIKIYSLEYGLTLKTIAQDRDKPYVINSAALIEEINSRFISKKTARDKKKKLETNYSKEEGEENDDEEDFKMPKTNAIDVNENLENENKNAQYALKDSTQNKVKENISKDNNTKELLKLNQNRQVQPQFQKNSKKDINFSSNKILKNIISNQNENKQKVKNTKITKQYTNSPNNLQEDPLDEQEDQIVTSSADEIEDIPYKNVQITEKEKSQKRK